MNYTIMSNSYNTTTSRTMPVTATAAAASAAASSLAPTTPTPTYTNAAVEAYSSPLFLSFLIIAFIIILFIRLLQIRNKEQQQLKFNETINNITTNANNNNNNNGEGASTITTNNNNGTTTGTSTEVGFGNNSDGDDYGGNHHHHHDLSNSDIVSRSSSGLTLKFSLEDRIELYNKTFDSNENQLILEGKHIKTKTTKTIASKSIHECGSISGNNNYSIFLDIEIGGKGNNYNEEYEDENIEEHDDDADDDDDDISSIYLSIELEHSSGLIAVTTSSTHLDEDNKDNKEQQMISSDGTCIVCFLKNL